MTSAGRLVRSGLLGCLALAMAGTAVSAQMGWVSGTYVYGDLCTVADAGTLAGRRVTLKRWPKSDNLVFESAGLLAPIETAVSIDDTTKDVAFAVETPTGPVSFRGTAGPEALVGTLQSAEGSESVRLKRVLRARAQSACPGETTGSIH